MDDLHLTVDLTDDRRTIALDYVVTHLGGDEVLEEALRAWPSGTRLRSAYRIEARMIVVLAEALAQRAHTE
jgi:hypothetical protein